MYSFPLKWTLKVLQLTFGSKIEIKPIERYVEYAFVLRECTRALSRGRVADIGCSGSPFPLLLAALGYKVYGIDIRKYTGVNVAEFPNFRFHQEDIRATQFPNDFFDAITAISAIEHIGFSRYGSDKDPNGDIAAVKEMSRVLKPEGHIFLTVPYGKAKTVGALHRIYDDVLLMKLVGAFKVEKEEYYIWNKKDKVWSRSPKTGAADIEGSATSYALAMLKLKKKANSTPQNRT